MNRTSEHLQGIPVPNEQQIERTFGGRTFDTDLGYPITLVGQKKFSAGEGVLFETDHPELIAKIPYEMTQEHEMRLQAFEGYTNNVPLNMDDLPLLVLPVSPLKDDLGKIRGELQPYIKSPYKLDHFMRILDREDRKDSKYGLQFLTLRELLLYGRQIAEALVTYHEVHGGVVGDLNRGGIIATRPRPRVGKRGIHPGGISIIDLSTSQIRDKNGQLLPSSGVAKNYVAPELFFKQHPHYKQIYSSLYDLRNPDKEPRIPAEDSYILALIMHELLFAEPITNLDPNRMKKPQFVPIGRTGRYAISNSGETNLDPTTLPTDMYGPKLRQAFWRSLVTGFDEPYKRADAAFWIEAIDETLDLLRPCPNGVLNHLVVEGTNVPHDCALCFTETQGAENERQGFGNPGRYFYKIK